MGHVKKVNYHWLLEEEKIAMEGSQTTHCHELSIRYVTVPQHGLLSLDTKLEGPSIAKLKIYGL